MCRLLIEIGALPSTEPEAHPVRHVESRRIKKWRRRYDRIKVGNFCWPFLQGVCLKAFPLREGIWSDFFDALECFILKFLYQRLVDYRASWGERCDGMAASA